jgi:hypothetical protein
MARFSWLVLIVVVQIFSGCAAASEALADGGGSRSRFPPPIPPQTIPSVAIDPSKFDPSNADEQIKQIRKTLEELANPKLPAIYSLHDEKTRITQLRDVLRDIVQFKLTLISVDGSLGQLRDAEIREAATARQILGLMPTLYNVGPNTPLDRLQKIIQADISNYNYAQEDIEQERKLLRALGGLQGDRLQMIDERSSEFLEKPIEDRIDDVRTQVRSILGVSQSSSGENSSLSAISPVPRTQVASPPSSEQRPVETAPEPQGKSSNGSQFSDQKDAKVDDMVERAVDAAMRLYRSRQKSDLLRLEIDFKQDVYENRKRLDDYHQVDKKIGMLRDQITELQAKIANLQDAINQAIDTSVNQIGGHEWFTQLATWIFGAAVVIVIGSFFALAFRDKENRLLSNPDVGLQFVTLFSIIIAIILFGILNILGSKELSALLGAISGYILGRGTLSSKGPNWDSDDNRRANHQRTVQPSTAGAPNSSPTGAP